MRIKIDKADRTFSQYIRLRDRECKRCHSRVELNDNGLPISHHASHYFGRGKEGTRFDIDNVDCLCMGCHKIWGSDNREEYRRFKIRQIGERGFQLMELKANSYCKKDRKMAWIIAKALLNKSQSKYI